VLPYIAQATAAGCRTLRAIAEAMQARGIRSPSGATAWYPSTVGTHAPAQREANYGVVVSQR
jgi:hypothetical protein